MKSKVLWLAVVLAFALVAAACSSDDEGGETTTTTGAETTTTAAETTTTTTRAPAPGFEGLAVDSGGCESDLGYNDAEGNPAVYKGKIDKITAVDEFTVQFDLCSTDPAFLPKAAFIPFGIQPEEHLAATNGAPLDNPVGTGPYSIVEWTPDSVVYERFDDYYGPKPAHQTAVLRWATEGAQRLLELQSGNVDGITFPSTDDYPVIENDPNTALITKPEPNVLYFGYSNNFAPFDDVNVRKAIALGIDRQRIVDTFYPEGSEVASHFTPCSVEHGCEGESWYDYDPEAAKAMLADAGFPDGFETEIFYRDVFRGYLPEPGAVAVDLQTQLKENLNIDATVTVMESGAFIAEAQAGNLNGIHLLGWTGDYPHITNFLNFHLAENVTQFGVNDPSYADPIAEASKTPDPAIAAPLYAEANTAIKEFVPLIPVLHANTAFASGSNVDGAYAPPWGQVLFHLWDNGEDTLVFMQGNEPISIYCADESDGESLRACAQVVEALYGYAPDGSVVPQLATECVSNEAGTSWTCTLRQGVVFHDGSTMDANDVVASWAVALDAADPLHVGNTGTFFYYSYLWDSLINPPEPTG